MKYAGIICFAVAAVTPCNPAWAGHGNALAGGWDGTTTSGNRRSAPAAAPATATPTVVRALSSGGIFAGPSFRFDSGGGGSGSAPSPEVNATLGLILVGGTVAILRRRRARKTELQA